MTGDMLGETWIPVSPASEFSIANLPYGVFTGADGVPHLGVALGERIVDLRALVEAGLLEGELREAALAPNLNVLLAAGRGRWSALRARLRELLLAQTTQLDGINRDALSVPRESARMQLPFAPGDYVDFYSSIEHATNLGKIFRPNGDPLMPNWRWMPIGYHGRSSTIVIDGTPVVRPCGQRPSADAPTFGPTRMLDIELEVGFVTGPGNAMGTRIAARDAAEHIFGLVLVNDWSARDIQAWEYQPLGPFLGKSFATSVSPWVVPLEALEPYRVKGPAQEPEPLAYLRIDQPWNFDVELAVELQSSAMRERGLDPQIVSRTNFSGMYWNMAQQLAHASVNGTAIRPGDLYASGTISGSQAGTAGSFIELTWRGANPLTLSSGEQRAFLEDGDTVTLRGCAQREGLPRIGFGSVSGTILPAV